jgi:hypothetical protein
MSLLSRAVSAAMLALVLVAPLAACTGIRPVYSDAGLGSQQVRVSYAAPANRLEQIVYQDLALRLGKSSSKSAAEVQVAVSERHVNLTNNTVTSATTQKQVTVTAKLTVTNAKGKVLFSGARSQTADYTTGAQALANEQAGDIAAKQAALLLSDTLRLQIIAALAK